MDEIYDKIFASSLAIISISLMILAICGGYAIVKKTNDPIPYNTQTINGNLPTLTIKGV